MNVSIISLLSWRYLTSSSSSTLRTMVGVCFASIFIGTFSLALIASIMRGFEYETHKTLQSIYPSIIVEAPEQTTLAYEPLRDHIQNSIGQLISGIAPYIQKEGLIHPATTDEPTYVVTLKGIDPQREGSVTTLEGMTEPHNTLKDLPLDGIIIGKDLAQTLEVSVGSNVVLVCNEEQYAGFKDAQLKEIPLTVAGVVTTGIADYDEHLVLIHLDLCKKIWGDDCITNLGISLLTPKNEAAVLKELTNIPEVAAYSWKTLYPALVSSLNLEQYVMFALLLLITLVASMNIVSLLFMLITYKRTDIALLKMFGMSTFNISSIFLCVSLFITLCAALTGLLAAYVTGRFLQWYPCITLPSDVYFVTHLPVKLELPLFMLVLCAVLLLSIGASLLPLRTIKKLHCTNTLRFE